MTAAILVQAMLAGLFISGTAPVLMAHTVIGSALSWFAIAPAVIVGLWVQETLGHMPLAVSTAIHVPLGVSLIAASVVLALASGRSRGAG